MLYDKDIREPLFSFLEERYGKVRVFEEKRTGRARADVVMVTEAGVCGIEIKSDADTYERLKKQVREYNKYYDFNYVAVGSSHGLHIAEHVPKWWGIITVEETADGADFYVLREAQANPKRKMDRKLALLWRPELNHLLLMNGLPAYKAKSKDFVITALAERVDEAILTRQVVDELFERDYQVMLQQIEEYKKWKHST